MLREMPLGWFDDVRRAARRAGVFPIQKRRRDPQPTRPRPPPQTGWCDPAHTTKATSSRARSSPWSSASPHQPGQASPPSSSSIPTSGFGTSRRPSACPNTTCKQARPPPRPRINRRAPNVGFAALAHQPLDRAPNRLEHQGQSAAAPLLPHREDQQRPSNDHLRDALTNVPYIQLSAPQRKCAVIEFGRLPPPI